jgi:UDP-glucose 4-epimerase
LKVLVTGGAGFIGSHIVELLVKKRIPVVVIDNFSRGQANNLHHIRKKFVLYELDITSSKLISIMEKEKPTHVIHHAAQASVQASIHSPLFDAKANIIGTLNVLEACRQVGVHKIIFASSAAVYGRQEGSLTEQCPTLPSSPYGLSKLTGEQYVKLYKEKFGLDYAILRYANVYGPRQSLQGEGGVVSIFINRLLCGEQVSIFGDGTQTRDFVFVEDVAKANLLALVADGSVVANISTNTAISICDLYKKLVDIIGFNSKLVYEPFRTGDLKSSQLANEKAKQYLGWQPRFMIGQGLVKTITYYEKKLARIINKEQIDASL